ncbi:MAG: cyclic nucleotide-binding domain-containing protein [Anaerolineae bacterium]|nr:cyclic nucleotide-binding domain-containing protein [Anaerolineae bacterium]
MERRMLSTEELDNLLATQPATAELFANAPDSYFLDLLASIDRQQLNRLMEEENHAQGEFIFQEGDRGDAMYLLRAGKVVVFKGDSNTPTILAYRGPGEIIGEMALLEDRPRSASIVAIESTRMLKISRDSFQELLVYNPSIGMSIMASLSARLRAADTVRDVDTQVGQRLIKQVSQLRNEKKELLELQRLREETSNFIIHDLRNPLGVVNGVIHLLTMVLPEEVVEENQKLLDAAKAASARMQLLVDALLDVARLESGQEHYDMAPTPLLPLMEKAGQRLMPTLTLHEITFTTRVGEDVPEVMLDEPKIDRVLTNLIDNAIKYTPNGGTITLAAERKDNYALISINDTGSGIPQEERERIFERFAQVAGDKPRRRGFGLGLTFCQLVVQGHGGRIWVEPGDQGIGSKFIFSLPL